MKISKRLMFVLIPVFMLSGVWLGYLKYADHRDAPADPRPSHRSKTIDDPDQLSADRVDDQLLSEALRDPTRFDGDAQASGVVSDNNMEDSDETAVGRETVSEEDRAIPLTPNWAVIEGTRRTIASYDSIRTEAMRDPDSDYNVAQRGRMMENMRQRLEARRGNDSPSIPAD